MGKENEKKKHQERSRPAEDRVEKRAGERDEGPASESRTRARDKQRRPSRDNRQLQQRKAATRAMWRLTSFPLPLPPRAPFYEAFPGSFACSICGNWGEWTGCAICRRAAALSAMVFITSIEISDSSVIFMSWSLIASDLWDFIWLFSYFPLFLIWITSISHPTPSHNT